MARPGDLNAWWRVGVPIVGVVARSFFRVRYIGTDRIPRLGPAIVAGNHPSALDGIFFALATAERARRMTRFLVASEFFDSPRLGPPLRIFQQIPVRRGMADASALDEAIRTIRGGAVAGILPEGRVNPDPFGPLQRGHSGAARVALAADAPIVPAGIWGTQHRWPRDGLTWRRPWRPTVVVAFGAPIRPEGSSGSYAEARQLTARLMTAIADQVEVARAMA